MQVVVFVPFVSFVVQAFPILHTAVHMISKRRFQKAGHSGFRFYLHSFAVKPDFAFPLFFICVYLCSSVDSLLLSFSPAQATNAHGGCHTAAVFGPSGSEVDGMRHQFRSPLRTSEMR